MVKIQPPVQPVRPATAERTGGVSSQRGAQQAELGGAVAAHSTTKTEMQRLRATRMEELEIALKSGTYKPDPDLVATRMVEASAFYKAIDEALAEEHPHGEHRE